MRKILGTGAGGKPRLSPRIWRRRKPRCRIERIMCSVLLRYDCSYGFRIFPCWAAGSACYDPAIARAPEMHARR